MLRIIDGLSVQLKALLAPADNQALISSSDALRLNELAVGDHIYLALHDGRGSELVKYTHAAVLATPPGTIYIPIDRAQGGTVRRAWPVKVCMSTSLAEVVLREFICQTAQEC